MLGLQNGDRRGLSKSSRTWLKAVRLPHARPASSSLTVGPANSRPDTLPLHLRKGAYERALVHLPWSDLLRRYYQQRHSFDTSQGRTCVWCENRFIRIIEGSYGSV